MYVHIKVVSMSRSGRCGVVGLVEMVSVFVLAAVAAMNPALECECPNHIAQLLIDLTAFEQYCGECKDTAPADAQLHAHLADITGQARQLLETALVAVAEADNLDLDRIGNSGNPAPQG